MEVAELIIIRLQFILQELASCEQKGYCCETVDRSAILINNLFWVCNKDSLRANLVLSLDVSITKYK